MDSSNNNVKIPIVAVHLDAPYFWGASRFHFPQWLLVCMVFSDLFYDKFVHQVQVVGYLHKWTVGRDKAVGNGGEFVFYKNPTDANDTRPSSIKSTTMPIGVATPFPRSGTLVDGSKVLHAAKVITRYILHNHRSFLLINQSIRCIAQM